MNRQFDLIIYGATGFVGKQAVAYFRQHYPEAKIAIAGRDANKLQAVARINSLADRDQIIVASGHDKNALDALATQTKVVLSTAGPFALYGSNLVAACVKAKTHYVDITGETPWVRQMIDQHHDQAASDATYIVPCCGFDSVPSDLGAYLCAQEVKLRYGEPCSEIRVVFTLKGGVNGGTLASIANIMSSSQDVNALRNLFLLNPSDQIPTFTEKHADVFAPSFDRHFQVWVTPFIMAAINTRVVRRTAALANYQSDSNYATIFSYQESMGVGKGVKGALMANTLAIALGASTISLQSKALRNIALSLGPKPGTGPTDESMNSGGFRCDYFAISSRGQSLKAKMLVKGDPGNRATTLFVCESAAALLFQTDELRRNKVVGGVLTPASAFGNVLAQRLRARPAMYEFELY